MDSEKYVSILEDEMIPTYRKFKRSNKNITYQHDNDPKHKSKLTITFLKRKNINVIEWPSYSPDLNPIENVWSILKMRVKKRNPINETELHKFIEEEWYGIESSILNNLFNSMPKRLRQVIENKGDFIFY